LHLLFFLANKQADDHFQALGYQQHKQEFCTGAASSSSNTDAQLAWHVLRLLRYVARPHRASPRRCTSRPAAPQHGLRRVRQQMSATASASLS
jgi:hypothetical protein